MVPLPLLCSLLRGLLQALPVARTIGLVALQVAPVSLDLPRAIALLVEALQPVGHQRDPAALLAEVGNPRIFQTHQLPALQVSRPLGSHLCSELLNKQAATRNPAQDIHRVLV